MTSPSRWQCDDPAQVGAKRAVLGGSIDRE
jgi:hypothetical protein